MERPRERLPCRPPGRLRAGAPLQPASWPHRLSSLLSKLFPFIRAAAVGRSRPAESSTSLFDRLGVMSSTGTSQVSSAQRIPRRAAALLEKMGCCSRGPWSAFPWSWRPPRSSTGKTKVVGLVELSMPAPLHHAHHDGIPSYPLALCDPPGPGTYVYVGPVGGSPPGGAKWRTREGAGEKSGHRASRRVGLGART